MAAVTDMAEAKRLVAWLEDESRTMLDRNSVLELVHFLYMKAVVANMRGGKLSHVLAFNYSNPVRALPGKIGFGSDTELILGKKLIREETRELFEAIDDRNFVKAVDGCADLEYVLLNMVGAHGLHHNNVWDAVFAEVHRSNMTKIFPDGAVRQREDGKILKPDHYEPPQIEAVLKAHGWNPE